MTTLRSLTVYSVYTCAIAIVTAIPRMEIWSNYGDCTPWTDDSCSTTNTINYCPVAMNIPCLYVYEASGGIITAQFSTLGITDITIQYDISVQVKDKVECFIAYSANNGGSYTLLKSYDYGDSDNIYLNEIVSLNSDSHNKNKIYIRLGVSSTGIGGTNFACFWDSIVITGIQPTAHPTKNPTLRPSNNPSTTPTKYPTNTPTSITALPTSGPTKLTATPTTLIPTWSPTTYPTLSPSTNPTITESLKVSKAFNTNLEIILFIGLLIVVIALILALVYIYKLKVNRNEAQEPILKQLKENKIEINKYGNEGK